MLYMQGKDVNNYLGFSAYDSNDNVIGDSWANPYFKTSENDPNRWKKWTGYVLPRYVHDGNNDGQPDDQSFHTNGVDWVWPPNVVTVLLRFGSCYGTGVGTADRTWFVFPSIRQIKPQLAVSKVLPTARTFDIASPQDWSTPPPYGGIAFVNGKRTGVTQTIRFPWKAAHLYPQKT